MRDFLLKDLFQRFFIIHKCGGCREILKYEERDEALCQSCALSFRVAKTESCPICQQSVFECSCMPRGLERAGALSLRKLYFYRAEKNGASQNKLLLNLKREPNRRVAKFVAQQIFDLIKNELSKLDIPFENVVLVSVPRGRRARRIHGFDQSEFVCGLISLISSIPYFSIIKRTRQGREQKKLDRNKRFRNVRSLFDLRDADAVRGKYVVLYDDVVTTGASMAACAELLRMAGALGVFCTSMAQVPQKSVK